MDLQQRLFAVATPRIIILFIEDSTTESIDLLNDDLQTIPPLAAVAYNAYM